MNQSIRSPGQMARSCRSNMLYHPYSVDYLFGFQ
jgi:hypothetical protein